MSDGAERALYGYRYQMLCAVDEAMDLHTAIPGHLDWSITIEDSQAEKADYSVTVDGRVIRAVQVKTSLPSTSRPRPLTAAPCAEIFEELAVVFPCADEIVIRTNLPVSYTPASGSRPSRRIHQEQETTTTMTQRLINRLSELRRLQGLP